MGHFMTMRNKILADFDESKSVPHELCFSGDDWYLVN